MKCCIFQRLSGFLASPWVFSVEVLDVCEHLADALRFVSFILLFRSQGFEEEVEARQAAEDEKAER